MKKIIFIILTSIILFNIKDVSAFTLGVPNMYGHGYGQTGSKVPYSPLATYGRNMVAYDTNISSLAVWEWGNIGYCTPKTLTVKGQIKFGSYSESDNLNVQSVKALINTSSPSENTVCSFTFDKATGVVNYICSNTAGGLWFQIYVEFTAASYYGRVEIVPDVDLKCESSTDDIINSQNQNADNIINNQNENFDELNDNLTSTEAPDMGDYDFVGYLPPGPVDKIITMPIGILNQFISALENNSCKPVTATLPRQLGEITFPCPSTYIDSMGIRTLYELIGTIAGAFALKIYLTKLYLYVNKLTHMEDTSNDWGGV